MFKIHKSTELRAKLFAFGQMRLLQTCILVRMLVQALASGVRMLMMTLMALGRGLGGFPEDSEVMIALWGNILRARQARIVKRWPSVYIQLLRLLRLYLHEEKLLCDLSLWPSQQLFI